MIDMKTGLHLETASSNCVSTTDVSIECFLLLKTREKSPNIHGFHVSTVLVILLLFLRLVCAHLAVVLAFYVHECPCFCRA